jgi:hypothetical protein
MKGKKRKLFMIAGISLLALIAILYSFQGIRSSGRLYPALFGQIRPYPMWETMKDFWIQGVDPYSKQGQARMEEAYFGRPLKAGEEKLVRDRQHFVYPLYVIFLYIPTMAFQAENAMRILWFLGFIMFMAAVLLSLRLNEVADVGLIFPWAAFFFLSWPQVYMALQSRQPQIWVLFFILSALYFISKENKKWLLIISGALLFFATIKPQSSFLIIVYILGIWLPAMGDRSRTYPVILGFLVTGGFFLLASLIFVPGWIGGFFDAIGRYREYAGSTGAESLWGKGWLAMGGSVFFSLVGLGVSFLSYQVKRNDIHLATCFYWLALQAFILPSHSYSVLMGIPLFILACQSGRIAFQAGKKILFYVILACLFLATYSFYKYWVAIFAEAGYFTSLPGKIDFLPSVNLPFLLIAGIFIFVEKIGVKPCLVFLKKSKPALDEG